MTVFTVGHSNHPLEVFLGLLAGQGIQAVVDVRSQPYSRYAPQYSRDELRAAVRAKGMTYVFEGEALGGRPRDPTCFGAAGEVDYAAVAAKPWFREGLERLVALARGQRTALLCSEEDPGRCHRHHLLAGELLARGVEVVHLRRSGALEPAAGLFGEAEGGASGQLDLFGKVTP